MLLARQNPSICNLADCAALGFRLRSYDVVHLSGALLGPRLYMYLLIWQERINLVFPISGGKP